MSETLYLHLHIKDTMFTCKRHYVYIYMSETVCLHLHIRDTMFTCQRHWVYIYMSETLCLHLHIRDTLFDISEALCLNISHCYHEMSVYYRWTPRTVAQSTQCSPEQDVDVDKPLPQKTNLLKSEMNLK